MAVDDTEPMEAIQASDLLCDECGKTFGNRGALTAHARIKHGGHEPWKGKQGPAGRAPKQDRPPAKRPPGRPRAAPPSLRQELEVTFALVAQMWQMRDPVCGSVAMAQVPQIALAWDTWARSNPSVHRILSMALSGGGAVGVVIAHAPIVIMVLQHHGPDRDRFFPPAPTFEAGPNGTEPAPADNQRVGADWGWPQYENDQVGNPTER